MSLSCHQPTKSRAERRDQNPKHILGLSRLLFELGFAAHSMYIAEQGAQPDPGPEFSCLSNVRKGLCLPCEDSEV